MDRHGKVTKKFTIELDEAEMEMFADAMDSKEIEELEKHDPGSLYHGRTSVAFEKAKELAKELHIAFMSK